MTELERVKACTLRRYHRRRDAGLCGLCGAVPEKPGRAICDACAQKHHDTAVRRYWLDVASRRCTRCHQPLRPTEWRKQCFACRMEQATIDRERRSKKCGI